MVEARLFNIRGDRASDFVAVEERCFAPALAMKRHPGMGAAERCKVTAAEPIESTVVGAIRGAARRWRSAVQRREVTVRNLLILQVVRRDAAIPIFSRKGVRSAGAGSSLYAFGSDGRSGRARERACLTRLPLRFLSFQLRKKSD